MLRGGQEEASCRVFETEHVYQNGKQNKQTKLQNGGATSTTTTKTTTKSDGLPQANMQLVGELREMLRHAYKENEASYSRHHYEEIMNESSPNFCWRYLLQRDEQVGEALELVKSALAWRKENGVEHLRPELMIKDFWMRTPIGFVGKTREGHELMYAIGKNFRKPEEPVRQMVKDFVTYMLFEWEQRHLHDLEQVVLIFDVTGTSFRNVDLDMANWFMSAVDFVPARIKAIYFVGIPLLLRPIFRLIVNWLPARFKRIVDYGSFEQLVSANVSRDSIPEEIGGAADNKWRRAPRESRWAHELEDDNEAQDLIKKLARAFSDTTTQEHLDKLYKMQADYEKSLGRTTG